MTTIYGVSTTVDRIKNDSMEPNDRVAIDHDFYSAHPERASKKMKEVDDEMKPSGYEMGYSGRMKPEGKDYSSKKSKSRDHKAIGGAAKWRQEFEGA